MNCTVCSKKLRKHNTIGTCRKHRGLSPVRRAYEIAWQQEHPDQYKEAKNQWNRDNPEYFTNWRNAKLERKIAHALRVRLRRAVKAGSAVKNLGCTVSEFLTYLENKFVPGMTWENYGRWHIDHVRPLSKFDLTNPNELEKACNYTNLQPLWAADNIRKLNKSDINPKSA